MSSKTIKTISLHKEFLGKLLFSI